MKNIKKSARMKAFLLSLMCVLLSINPITVKADENWPKGPEIVTPNAIVMEINTKTVLYEKDSKKELYPASITKILTTLLAIENCNLDEVVTFSKDAVYKNEGDTSHISRDIGEEMTLEQCLYAVMLESANECAYAVAEHVGKSLGGDYQTFIDLMNKRAKELGCENTHFTNCNGLPDENHWTCPYDMALISAAAYQNETFRNITGTASYVIPKTNKHKNAETPLNNHHKMLHRYKSGNYVYEYCKGGKTGYTTVARSTLVTYAEKDGMPLVCVVMNTESPQHWNDTRALFDFSFDNFYVSTINENEEILKTAQSKDLGVLNNNGPFVTLDENAYIVLPKTAEFSDAKSSIAEETDESTIATLSYTYAGREVGNVKIQASGVKAQMPEFSDQEPTEIQEDDINVITIKPEYIIFMIVMIAILILAIIIVVKLVSGYSKKHYERRLLREENRRYHRIRERKGHSRRKRDRMFR